MKESTTGQSGVQMVTGRVRDAFSGLVGRINAELVQDADAFVSGVSISDAYEREAARVALRRSASSDVKAVAERMIRDHTTSTHHLQAALEMKETARVADPPDGIDERRSRMIEHLQAVSSDRFDKVYLEQQVLAHEEALVMLQRYRDHGDNDQLRSFAAGSAPVVLRHLRKAKALKSSLRT